MLKWLQIQDGELVLGFPSLMEAERFLRSQTHNPQWLNQWTFAIRDDHVEARTKHRVVLHFQLPPSEMTGEPA